MQPRKEMKKRARKVLRKHYWLFVVLCLLAAVLGTEFASSLTVTKNVIQQEKADANITTAGTAAVNEKFSEILYDIVSGKDKEGRELADEITEEEIAETKANPGAVLGRSRGIFSSVVNGITSGGFLVSLAVGLTNIMGSNSAAVTLMIIASLLLLYVVWIFGVNVYQVIMRRLFLEGRCYGQVHKQRALFLLKERKWCRTGVTLFVLSIYKMLWMFTVVGGVIKRYSYYLVPYLVAERPELNSREAITLSRRLMKGHKWECFVFELSFIGWYVLGGLTWGLSSIFYTNPYKTAAFCEYYDELRRLGKENNIPDAELLTDQYLFEKAGEDVLLDAYQDVAEQIRQGGVMQLTGLKGIRKFLANVFGLTISNGRQEKEYEESQARMIRMASAKDALEGRVYPTRLSPIPEKLKRKWVENIHYIRNYSVWSIVLMFFIMSFVGWLWEVSLHLVSDGIFINRGVLHGPWLPIYGTGSILILLLLNKFRRYPALEFMTAIIVCGVVEYFTSYYLELVHNGKKWWDYSGYFLNLNGRICAEGLLTFGLGGMMIVYILAPVLDNVIRRIPYKALIAACLILLGTFAADQVYSKKYPNEGKGITDYTGAWIEHADGEANTPALSYF